VLFAVVVVFAVVEVFVGVVVLDVLLVGNVEFEELDELLVEELELVELTLGPKKLALLLLFVLFCGSNVSFEGLAAVSIQVEIL
jgi:hypothetical protein